MNRAVLRQPTPRRAERGVALIITLLFLTIIAIIVVGFSESARLERSAARSHFDRQRAATFAQYGVERTLATLQRETIDPPDPTAATPEAQVRSRRNWISQPGALIVALDADPKVAGGYKSPLDNKQLRRVVELSSGEPNQVKPGDTSVDRLLLPPNLNVRTLAEENPPTYLITDRPDPGASSATATAAQMHLRWIYVRQNGDFDVAEKPAPSNAANPIVGRFAYWADDESSKINYNLAWKRDTPNTLAASANPSQEAHPSRINMMALTLKGGTAFTEPLADRLNAFRTGTPGRFFNSFADARGIAPLFAAERDKFADMLDFNRFELTHYNHDPDTTFFGEDRILLTMNPKLVPKLLNPDGTPAKGPTGKPIYLRKFLDILRDDIPAEQLDPGILEHLAGGQPDWSTGAKQASKAPLLPNKLDAVVRMLMRYISATNWPLSPGVSFKDKYYPGTSDADGRLGQIAVNIIDYVRAKESPQPFVAPLRFAIGPSDAVGDNANKFTLHPSYTYGAPNSYQGISRAPYITEMGMWMEQNPVPPPSPTPSGWPKDDAGQPMKLWRCYFKGELFLPPNYGFDDKYPPPSNGIELVPDTSPKPATGSVGWFFSWTETRDQSVAKYYHHSPNGQMVVMNSHGTNAARLFTADLTGMDGTMLKSNKRLVVTKLFYRDKAYADRKTLAMRAVLYKGVTGSDGLLEGELNRWPRVNIGTQAGAVSYTIGDPQNTTANSMPSLETDDPRCNIHPSDWVQVKQHTLGASNFISTVGKAPTKSPVGKPQQDTDEKGLISDYSLSMPPPAPGLINGGKGVGSNDSTHDQGRVTTIGELGYIHTGNDAKVGSIPWRTIRLQPNNYPDAKTLPDWAFMDLFTVPNTGATGPEPIYRPHGTSLAGRINVNAHVEPFPKMIRDRGLVALLTGTRRLPTAAVAEPVARNLHERILAPGKNPGKYYGYPWPSDPTKPLAADKPNAFDTPGEICEIAGVADGGEASEDLVREISSLVTSRGNVFSVYTIGQALRQTPQGKLLIAAEQRQHAILERYLDTRGTPDPRDDETRLRTVYFRNLMP